MVIPEKYNGLPVTQILEYGFSEKYIITSVELPSSLVKINEYAFYKCVNLTEVIIPNNVNLIGKCAFFKSGLTSATLSNPNDWACGTEFFEWPYYSITDYSSATVKKYDLSQPENVAAALKGPVEIDYVRVHPTSGWESKYRDVHWYLQDWVCTAESDGTLTYVLQDDGTYGVKAASLSSSVTEITIPATYKGLPVTTVLEKSFKGMSSLEKVVISEGITTIDEYAFYGCNSAEIYIPKSVSILNSYSLYNVKTIMIDGTNNWTVSQAQYKKVGDSSISRKNFADITLSSEVWSSKYNYKVSGTSYEAYLYTGTWSR